MQKCTLSQLDINYVKELSSLKKEPAWLIKYRENSIKSYHDLSYEQSPLYVKYTDAKKMDPDQIYLSVYNDNNVPTSIQTRLNELKDSFSIIQLGSTYSINIPQSIQSQGLIISSIDDAIQNNNDYVKQSFESISNNDKYTALNNTAFNCGLFIYVPKNLTITEPLHILCSLPQDDLSIISRNLLVLDDNSNINIIQELYSSKSTINHGYFELLDTNVSSNSTLNLTSLQLMDQNAINFSTRKNTINNDGKVNWYLGLFGSLLSRYKIDHHLIGTGATVNDYEVVFGNNEQSFDLSTNVNHENKFTNAKIIEKSIMRDKSKSLFKGMIRINENANKSKSFLSGHSILLNKDAKSDSIPGLEIFTNDVKATHSASVSQINDEQIFYLMTRCLDKKDAERIIVEGFLEPLSRTMSYQTRAWISYLIESKWENRELTINTDDQLKKLVEVEETRYNENNEIEQHYKYR